MEQTPSAAARLDAESAEWLQALAGTGPRREAALAQLHGLLVRIAQGRSGGAARGSGSLALTSMTWPISPPADAMAAITGKLGQFRSEGAHDLGVEGHHVRGAG